MTGARWQRAKQIFNEALEKSGPERDRFVGIASGDDKELRAQVEGLLAAHMEAGEFLASPTGPDPSEAVKAVAAVLAAGPPEAPGTRIGPYKLLQVIGEGGFGVVYMAEQEHPIRRRVALKVIKLGMDTKEVIARFEAERQALALMDHPNIARVLDAGATESGRPFFVMELVKGAPITEYCDTNQLSTRERLDLFTSVCRAVHHAHEKGVIHRDIKPSNVMVTLHDGTPVPKVIDFGIAKAMNQPLTEKTLFTAFGEFVGTPWCMSPEQAAMSGLEIDRRCDVYALGVLLYELLTGTTPFDAEKLRSRAFLEIMRIVREEDPPTPSARLNTLGKRLAEVANRRHVEPHALAKLLRGDLDWIVMKAMEKDRRRRYDSAADLADDLLRHFRYQPVNARRPGIAYRIGKFARRRRGPIVAAAGIAVAVLSGIALAALGGERARAAVTGLTTREAWAGPGGGAMSSVSIDGRYLTYVDPETGNLAIRDLQTMQNRRVTTTGSWTSPTQFAEASTISPDTRQIAYAWYNERGFYELRLIGRDGGEPRVVYHDDKVTWVRPFDWSPDGKLLAALFSRRGSTNQLVLISVADGSVRVIKDLAFRRIDNAAFSPDGRYIAYDFPPLGDAPERDVFLLGIHDGRESQVVRHPANDFLLGWFPDGNRLLFASDRQGANGAWALRISNGGPQGEAELVKAEMGGVNAIGFTRTGEYYYGLITSMPDVYIAALDSSGNVVDAPNPLRVRYQEQKSFATWSPNGDYIAYLVQRPPSRILTPRTISILTLKTGHVRDIPLRMSIVNHPIWMPNGQSVIVGGRDLKRQRMVGRVDLSTGSFEPIVHNARRPEISPDGRTLFYQRITPAGEDAVVARDLSTGREVVVYPRPTIFALSPDGRWLALKGQISGPDSGTAKKVALRVMPASGGEPRTVLPLDDSETNDHERLAWTRDGQYLIYVRGEGELWRVPVDGGTPHKLGIAVPQVTRLSMHPDGRRIAISAGFGKTDVWVMENLLSSREGSR